MIYKLNERDCEVIEQSYKNYGEVSAPFLMIKLRCSVHKAKWICENIKTREDLKRYTRSPANV